MTRCLDERELYAMDGSLLSRELRAHLGACPVCAAKRGRLEAMRAMAVEATRPEEPNWRAVDARVMFAVRARLREGIEPPRLFTPLRLSLAAALAVAVGLAVGGRALMERKAPAAVMSATRAPFAVEAPPPAQAKLDAFVTDRIGRELPSSGGHLSEGAAVEAGACGAVLTAVGEDIAIDARDGAQLTLVSLDAVQPTARLERGTFYISVFDGPMSPELIVLAAHEEFSVLSGFAEVLFVDDAVEVRAMSGPLLVEIGGGMQSLAAGEGLRRARKDWIDLDGSKWKLEADSPMVDLRAIEPSMPAQAPHGTLPVGVVRELLQSNADKIRTCYESALKRYSKLESLQIEAKLNVSTSGRVARVRLDGTRDWPVLERCLSGVFEEIQFPKPQGGEVELEAPLRLEPRQ